MTVGELYLVAAVLAFAAIFVTGRRLRGLPKTRNGLILAAHKILSLAAVVLIAVMAYRVNAASALAVEDWAALVVAGVLLAGTMASGGLLSASSTAPNPIRVLHRVTSIVTIGAVALVFYFLLVRI